MGKRSKQSLLGLCFGESESYGGETPRSYVEKVMSVWIVTKKKKRKEKKLFLQKDRKLEVNVSFTTSSSSKIATTLWYTIIMAIKITQKWGYTLSWANFLIPILTHISTNFLQFKFLPSTSKVYTFTQLHVLWHKFQRVIEAPVWRAWNRKRKHH